MNLLNRKQPEPIAEAKTPEVIKKPPRPLVEKAHERRTQKQAELFEARAVVLRLDAELCKLRADELWLEDHPEVDEIFARLAEQFPGEK